MTPRYSLVGFVATLVVVASPALAGWGPDGATIKATTSHIAKIGATTDGAYGSFVVWQEESTPGTGVLRAQHVLPSGDVDPAWPADGMLLCSTSAPRSEMQLVADGLGGAYVWWKEGAAIYLSRILANGTVAAGWPARGRSIGSIYPASAKPSVIADGAHGIYMAWSVNVPLATDPMSVVAVHLGPANTGAGGWPSGTRGIAGGDPVATLDYWPSLALAPDGGIFVAWAKYSFDAQQVPSAYLLRRLTSAGLNAAGWDPAGVDLGVFHGEWLDTNPETGLVGLAPDELGGVYALIGYLTGFDGYNTYLESRLLRRQGDGTPATGWPETGIVVSGNGVGWYGDVGVDASHRALPDGLGGVLVGTAQYYDHGTSYQFAVAEAGGGWKPYSQTGAGIPGYELANNHNGGVFVASFWPKGPYQMYDPYAYLSVRQSLAPGNWTDFFEIHFDNVVTFYGDIALAASGDGGAIFFWSQERERFGLFARRFNGAGQVTGVDGGGGAFAANATALALGRLRFVAGEGVRASIAVPVGEAASLDLYDVGGRRVAASRIEAATGGRELTLGGTRDLASGLYFAKLATTKAAASGRVVVER